MAPSNGVATRRVKLAALYTSAVGIALCAAAMLLGRLAPASDAAATAARAMPLAEPAAQRADAALRRGDWDQAIAQSRAELSVSPVRQDAWLRIAEADVGAHGRLTETGIEALSHAYDAAPYDLDPSAARRVFVDHHLSELSKELLVSVEDERRASPLR